MLDQYFLGSLRNNVMIYCVIFELVILEPEREHKELQWLKTNKSMNLVISNNVQGTERAATQTSHFVMLKMKTKMSG